jgi:DNA-directed RNA polymerase specialized sigma24 family protein
VRRQAVFCLVVGFAFDICQEATLRLLMALGTRTDILTLLGWLAQVVRRLDDLESL